MTAPNSQIAVSAGAGTAFATATIASKEVLCALVLAASGHIQETVPTYSWWVPSAAAGPDKVYADLFNASGSGKVIDMLGIWAIPPVDALKSVTLAIEVGMYRTSAVGTGGTAHTYNGGTSRTAHVIDPMDTTNSALPAQVTARALPTGGATIAALYWAQYLWLDEGSVAEWSAYVTEFANLLPAVGPMHQRLTLREGQGLVLKQGATVGAGSVGFLGLFTLTP
jgi:hypothetical protein